MTHRFKTKEEAIEALRKEPAFKDLVEILKSQTPDQTERLADLLEKGDQDDAEDSGADSDGDESETP